MKPQPRSPDATAAPALSAPIAPEDKQRQIAEAAYAKWERRGFAHGADVEDWLEAETELEKRVRP